MLAAGGGQLPQSCISVYTIYIYIHIYIMLIHTLPTHIHAYRVPMDPTGQLSASVFLPPVLGLGAATKSRQSGDSMHPPTCTCF